MPLLPRLARPPNPPLSHSRAPQIQSKYQDKIFQLLNKEKRQLIQTQKVNIFRSGMQSAEAKRSMRSASVSGLRPKLSIKSASKDQPRPEPQLIQQLNQIIPMNKFNYNPRSGEVGQTMYPRLDEKPPSSSQKRDRHFRSASHLPGSDSKESQSQPPPQHCGKIYLPANPRGVVLKAILAKRLRGQLVAEDIMSKANIRQNNRKNEINTDTK